MKPFAGFTIYVLSWTILSSVQAVQPMSFDTEQTAIKTLIEKMYFYDPATFEYGDFDQQLRPYTRKYLPNKQAKYRPDERCKLLKTMMTEAMLPVTPPKKDCDALFGRFPNIGSEDLSPATRDSFAFTEKFTIAPPLYKAHAPR